MQAKGHKKSSRKLDDDNAEENKSKYVKCFHFNSSIKQEDLILISYYYF